MVNLGRIIIRMEKARGKLLSVDTGDREKLLAASRKVDRLILEYYRAKFGCQGKTEALQ